MAKEIIDFNGYELSRKFFDWCFDNPDKVKPNHIALYFFALEHCNRLGWREKFGLPTEMAKSAIGIHSYNTYVKTLNDLVSWGFIKVLQKSKNQFSSNIIAISKFNKATTKALDKATIKHVIKQSESTEQSTGESIDSINKPINQEPINQEQQNGILPSSEFLNVFSEFSKMRVKIKKPLTEHARKLILEKLEKLAPGNEAKKIEILNQSIIKSWQDVFPIKENQQPFTQQGKKYELW